MPLQADRTVRSRLQFISDVDGLEQARVAMDALEESMKRTEQRAARLRQIRTTFIQIARTGRLVAAAGASITAALTAPAVAYSRTVGKLEVTSIKWLRTQERLKDATVALGRETATALLPQMERLVSIAEKAAAMARRHPGLVSTAASIGGIATAVGGLAIVLGEAARVATFLAEGANKAVGALTRMAGASKVLQTLGIGAGGGGLIGSAGSAGLAAGMAALVAALGLLTLHIIGLKRGYEKPIQGAVHDAGVAAPQQFFITIGMFLKMVHVIIEAGYFLQAGLLQAGVAVGRFVNSLGWVIENMAESPAAQRFAQTGPRRSEAVDSLGELGRTLQDIGISSKEADKAMGNIQAGLDDLLAQDYENFANQLKTVGQWLGLIEADKGFKGDITPDTTFSFDQLDSFERFLEQTEQMEAEHQATRTQMRMDFHNQTTQLEAEYQRQRTQVVQENAKRRRRAEEDLARNLGRMWENYRDRVADIVENFQEQEADAREDYRRRELERVQDFQRQRERNLEEHLLRLKDAAGRLDAVAVLNEMQRFALSDRQAKEDFQRDSERRADEYARERMERQKAFAKQLADAKEAYEKQRQQAIEDFEFRQQRAEEDFQERLRQMDDDHRRMMAARRQQFIDELREFDEQFRVRMRQRDAQFAAEFGRLLQHNSWTEAELARHYQVLREQLYAFIAGNYVPSGSSALEPRPGETYYEIDTEPYSPHKIKIPNQTSSTNPVYLDPSGGLANFHTGGRIGRTGPAMVHQGEEVLSARVAASLRSGMGGGINEQLKAMLSGGGRTLNTGGVNVFGAGGTPEQMESAVMNALMRALERV